MYVVAMAYHYSGIFSHLCLIVLSRFHAEMGPLLRPSSGDHIGNYPIGLHVNGEFVGFKTAKNVQRLGDGDGELGGIRSTGDNRDNEGLEPRENLRIVKDSDEISMIV